MSHLETRIDTSLKYAGRIINVRLDTARVENGNAVLREVVEHPGGVAVLPLNADGTVACVRQYRYPFGRELLEIPAGKLEAGEDPLECAKRELEEETGYRASEYVYLGPVLTSPGFSTEVLHIYLAAGLIPGRAHPDLNEFLSVEHRSLDELLSMVMSGEISDAKTTIAVLKTKRYLEAQNV